MRKASVITALAALFLTTPAAYPQCASAQMGDIIGQLDGARMKANVEKLVTFGTRSTLSDATSPTRGIGAARKWIFDEMSKYAAASGGRMTVAYQSSMQSNKRTGDKPVEVVNVVVTIKGTSDSSRVYLATGHYDSRNSDAMDGTADAPGADDDGSGTVVIMELDRKSTRLNSSHQI